MSSGAEIILFNKFSTLLC